MSPHTNSTTTTSVSSSSSAGDHCGGNPITAIHPDIIQTHILNRLDGATLASTSSTSSQFLSLCNDDQLWRQICNSTWPSTTHPRILRAISAFPSAHRSFYSDSFPSFHHPKKTRLLHTSELISAVDIFYKDQLIYSKVLVTETVSNWFLSFPLSLELLDPKEIVPTPLKFDGEPGGACNMLSLAEEDLSVSWILIDPKNKRAVNVASHRVVESRLRWSDGNIQLRFATVAAVATTGELVQCAVVITCGGKEGGGLHVKEVGMKIEDIEGRSLSGRDSLGIIQAAMEGGRRRIDSKLERDIYGTFTRNKVQYREKEQRRETGLDMICIVVGLSISCAIWIFFLYR